MTNQELIELLQRFPPDLEVLITDGYRAQGYRGEYLVAKYVDYNGQQFVDIGVGGLDDFEEH